MIAITGQLGGLAVSFALAAKHAGETVVALSRDADNYRGIDHWRLGSLASQSDLEQMLTGIDCVIYFCLTPPSDGKTKEGLAHDVAIYDALNFAHVASMRPDLHVVLVTRIFPDDGRTLGNTYALWDEVNRIFDENIPWLTTIRTAPLWSENDPLTLGMMAFAQHHDVPEGDVRFYNLTSPAFVTTLSNTLLDTAKETEKNSHCTKIVEGNCAVSYGSIIQCMKSSLSKRHIHRALTSTLRNEFSLGLRFEDLFKETVVFHTSGENNIHRAGRPEDSRKVYEQCRDFVTEMQDVSLTDALISRIGNAARKGRATIESRAAKSKNNNYIYRIARNPRRGVREIAELFVQWLPRHLYRIVRMDPVGPDRMICKIANIPLFEVETSEESWQRAQLLFRHTWSSKCEQTTRVVVSITGTQEQPREVLIVVEDISKKIASIVFSESSMRDFGQYLRDYGVAE